MNITGLPRSPISAFLLTVKRSIKNLTKSVLWSTVQLQDKSESIWDESSLNTRVRGNRTFHWLLELSIGNSKQQDGLKPPCSPQTEAKLLHKITSEHFLHACLQGQKKFCALASCFCASLLYLLREWVGWKLKVLYLWDVTGPRDHFSVVLLWALNRGYLATCEPMFYVKILCGRNCMRIDLLMAGTARLCIVAVGWDRKTAQCSEVGMRQGRECGNCTLRPKKKRRNSEESKSSSSEWALAGFLSRAVCAHLPVGAGRSWF